MELALGIDSRDVPAARYADPQEQLARLEEEERKYDKIIMASRVAKYGSLGAMLPLFGSNGNMLGHSAIAFTAATAAAFTEDRAKQKSMVLKVKKEEIKRAANPQLYIEKAIEKAAEDLKYEKRKEELLYEDPRGHKGVAFASARKRIELQQEKLDLYSQAYELARKNGKIEELSHLICRCESYDAIEPLKTKSGLREPLHALGYLTGSIMAGGAVALGDNFVADKIVGGIILAEMGAIFVKNVARLVKNRKIDKEEEKAYDAINDFVKQQAR